MAVAYSLRRSLAKMEGEPAGAGIRPQDAVRGSGGEQRPRSGGQLVTGARDLERRRSLQQQDPLVVLLQLLDRVGSRRADDRLDARGAEPGNVLEVLADAREGPVRKATYARLDHAVTVRRWR